MRQHHGSIQTSLTVLLALLLLLSISVVAAHFPLGAWSSAVALGIAAIKAGLIAWYFMHLQNESSLIRVLSSAGVFCLAIMLALLTTDYGDRDVKRLEIHQRNLQQKAN